MTDRQDDSGAHVATLQRLREALPTVGINGWSGGVVALDAAIRALSPQGSEPAGVGDAFRALRQDYAIATATVESLRTRLAACEAALEERDAAFYATPAPAQQAVTAGLTATEALFGFMGWLTSREPAVTFGAKHEASTAVELISQFMQANGLPDCREDWTTRLTHPVTPDNTTAQGDSK